MSIITEKEFYKEYKNGVIIYTTHNSYNDISVIWKVKKKSIKIVGFFFGTTEGMTEKEILHYADGKVSFKWS